MTLQTCCETWGVELGEKRGHLTSAPLWLPMCLWTGSFVSVPLLVKSVRTGGLPSSLQICWKGHGLHQRNIAICLRCCIHFQSVPVRNPWGSSDCSGSFGLWHSIFLWFYQEGMYTAHLPSSLHKRPPPQSYTGQNEIESLSPLHPGPWACMQEPHSSR